MSNAAERAYHIIRQRIMDGSFPPGSPLRETLLASEIGVSRTPIRDALRRLLADGLVDSTRNYGTFVAEISQEDVQEVWQLRAMLEGFAARRAALRITEEELAELRRLADAMEALDGPDERRIARFATLNTEFHAVMIRAARSRRLEGMLGRAIQVPLVLLKQYRMHEWVNIDRSNRYHREIIDALAARNAEWAGLVVSAHLNSTRPASLVAEIERSENIVHNEGKARG
ncbi:GntR family transcriptional regulator [Roseomonas marmotae]|uniref:GntR family transcriptional regulator n=1 Tax=Roseomonas marmotae TaxID=2768161 RepID=A0ABS3KA73_9PROT|nr:GntR family transcriptional regulator [Roseomonas marmotae]MBO1073850.1 GntR family transcriptional regulator [Roseomonas marmotae]QTI78521.1 GntR family transcriptional regulator [Roseomonas marmotae]